MKVSDLIFAEKLRCEKDTLFIAYTELGRFTVLNRLTGYGTDCDIWDTETGFKDKDGLFWLAAGDFDIRDSPNLSLEDAIEFIKKNANVCKGI